MRKDKKKRAFELLKNLLMSGVLSIDEALELQDRILKESEVTTPKVAPVEKRRKYKRGKPRMSIWNWFLRRYCMEHGNTREAAREAADIWKGMTEEEKVSWMREEIPRLISEGLSRRIRREIWDVCGIERPKRGSSDYNKFLKEWSKYHEGRHWYPDGVRAWNSLSKEEKKNWRETYEKLNPEEKFAYWKRFGNVWEKEYYKEHLG